MDPANIEVRRHLREVDTYRQPASWEQLTPEKQAVITDELAGLPTAFQEDEHSEEAKRFDYLLLRLQLAYLNADPRLCRTSRSRCRDRLGAARPDDAQHPGCPAAARSAR